ncbi:GNAT family N-acetyltransferase [Bacillus sp. RG28]|uniref:GNAT family N-acetyltransferase n=1 Tax=Gottfriedia endophytica TaxID=2820819 RepID=A0A940SKL2_9BACI|nr:GNAT family protein [Gottfriedia endophytica]MBP0725373.1 GNAT family N-acetyltransferase [Gottfriedia endophytica]
MTRNLVSKRVVLREIKEKDWVDVHKYASNEIVCQFQPWGPNTEIESKTFVKEAIEDAEKEPRTRFVFAIIEKKNEIMIGSVEFNIRDVRNRTGEIGYIVNPDYWGKGFATEAANLILAFGFQHFNLHRIYATCDPRNIASSKVLEKICMTKEGRLREDLLLKEGWRDSLLYSILEQEWTEVVNN